VKQDTTYPIRQDHTDHVLPK